jgi:GntR family transcriptional repressor for pyruvate dehydrogenase complex
MDSTPTVPSVFHAPGDTSSRKELMGNMKAQIDWLPRGRPRQYSRVLSYEILSIMSELPNPMGSGTLEIELRKRGYHLSAPTIGRKLREIEVSGYLAKVGVQGRTLTEAGRIHLRELEREVNLQCSSEALHRLIAHGNREEILDLLEARRILEREIIRLAVRKATDSDLARIEDIIRQQEDRVAAGGLAVKEDVQFHDAIAEIGGSKVLRLLLSILRHQGQYSFIISYIRSRVGGRLVVDHREILEAMRRREVDRAQRAIDSHLQGLIRDVERYWRPATALVGQR